MRMIAYALEEDAAPEQADLEGRDVDVGAVLVPCPRSYGVRYDSGEEAVEVEQEEESEQATDQDINEVDPVEPAIRTKWLRRQS